MPQSAARSARFTAGPVKASVPAIRLLPWLPTKDATSSATYDKSNGCSQRSGCPCGYAFVDQATAWSGRLSSGLGPKSKPYRSVSSAIHGSRSGDNRSVSSYRKTSRSAPASSSIFDSTLGTFQTRAECNTVVGKRSPRIFGPSGRPASRTVLPTPCGFPICHSAAGIASTKKAGISSATSVGATLTRSTVFVQEICEIVPVTALS